MAEIFASAGVGKDRMQSVEMRLWASSATMRDINTMLFSLGYALSFEGGLLNCLFLRNIIPCKFTYYVRPDLY